MRVLWFEITTPSRYLGGNTYLGGWQDSLEKVVSERRDIELYVSFVSKGESIRKDIDNIHYLPISYQLSVFQKVKRLFTWSVDAGFYVKEACKIIDNVKPDIIHIFGTEYPFGLISRHTDVPVVIHIQGSIIPYINAEYPPGYSLESFVSDSFPNIARQLYSYIKDKKQKTRVRMEGEIWANIKYYMGRTVWDKALVSTLHPNASYYVVNEALRPTFIKSNVSWSYHKQEKLLLLSIGIGTFWKGPDMMLKTAKILKSLNINFEWFVAGSIREDIRKVVEKHEKSKFEENNITILGYRTPDQLINLMTQCSLFVHCAYIDNSPNSICEAQILGVPVISTHVGGIESLIENEETGFLVPANDPWRMAYSILRYSDDEHLLTEISERAKAVARARHDNNQIYNGLLNCYKDILVRANNESLKNEL